MRPAGALVFLLALALAAGGILPAQAQGPIPAMPHGFAGTVSTLTPPQLVPQGTLVQAFVDGVKKVETGVKADGTYELLVSGPGMTVTFRVAGVLAQQSAPLQAGDVQMLDLTIDALPTVTYSLTMAVAPADAGTATDVSNNSPYAEGVEVDIKAVAAAGYGFVSWTSVPAVVFADVKSAETSFAMPASAVTVTANFGPAYALTLGASPAGGGSVIDVLGKGGYAAGGRVSIKAQPAAGYEFVNWEAVPAVVFANPNDAETTFTMVGAPVTVTAKFVSAGFTLTLAASPLVGGTVSVFPVQEVYQAGASVQIQAVPASGYRFLFWTPEGGTLGNANLALTTFAMPAANAKVTAVFQLETTGGGAVCFIATAAYGSPSAEQIDVLREFRDNVLLNSAPGSHFVALYYWLSPPVAKVISGNSFLRTMVRELLIDPLVWLVEATGDVWRD